MVDGVKYAKIYTVELSACGNIDYGDDPYGNVVAGRRVLPNIAAYNSIEECQLAVRKYISYYQLGAGNWSGGKVFLNDTQIGYISYNGNYWPKGSKWCRE